MSVVAATVREELNIVLSRLPDDNLRALLHVLRRLGGERRARRWSRAVGSLSDAEADEMLRIIEGGCENVDADTW